MSAEPALEPAFQKKLREQPCDWQTKNEYEEVTLRQQPYLHGQYRNIHDERDYTSMILVIRE
ncbi:hypothetical protein [Aneurinibacillus terranovensis]|uniref:hypothetical protein n=1 Tax=Aneurinibacillus terranovensis TaxID=278991 RepID=UPI000486C5D2|nr:hypothetical protein [Aneurinibacillus terranovensis]